MSTRTTLLDSRVLDLVIPALTGIPEDTLIRHLQSQESVHWAIREVLGCSRLAQVNRQQLHQVLYEGLVTTAGIRLPKARLAKNEPIRQMFPGGWYMVCPAGVDLAVLHQNVRQFNTRFYSQDDPWFLNEGYGEWPDSTVEQIPTLSCEIFIPDPAEWLIPGSKGLRRDDCQQMQREFGKTLPDGWECPEPAIETLTLAGFERHRQSGDYPLPLGNAALCSNRYDRGHWLDGGYFGPDGWYVDRWDADGSDFLGALRWAVRYGRVGRKTT